MRKLGILLAIPLLSACSMFGTETVRSGASSSLVDYLYPDGRVPPERPAKLPNLSLPVRVGIAFVPSAMPGDFGESKKTELLVEVAAAFSERPYVSSIEVLSDQYLSSTRGMVGMQQVASLHGLDVMALVSYDQLAFSGERDAAIWYWTIVGTAVVKGNTNEVQTMIDTAVFDVSSGQLLFRAPGTQTQQRNATLFDSASDLRHLREESLASANTEMIANLDGELARFEDRVKAGEAAEVAWRDGSGGGGALGYVVLAALLAFALGRRPSLQLSITKNS